MEIASQTTLITGLCVLGVGLVIALLGRLMASSPDTSGGAWQALMSIFAGTGMRVGGWVVMGIGCVISIAAGVMHLSGA